MTLAELYAVPQAQRDDSWEDQFLTALATSRMRVLSADPVTGPDGFPYLLAEIADEATDSAQNVLGWLSTRGMGLIVNPREDYPDFVLSWGMIWSFRETGRFVDRRLKPQESKGSSTVTFNLQHAGTPTETYLPLYVRKMIREFLRDQGVLAPKVLVVSENKKDYDLAVSLESLGSPKSEEHAGICEALAWFLPPHYSLILASEKGWPPFSDL